MTSVLVVDDEPDVLHAFARALRIHGFAVEYAGTAEIALKLCAEHSFDAVVLDYIMPSMTGIELLNEIRSYIPTIRSVIVSGKLDTQEDEASITLELRDRIEADVYLHKPVANTRLVDALNEALASTEQRTWVDIAERNLNAKKPKRDVRIAEKSVKRLRRPKS